MPSKSAEPIRRKKTTQILLLFTAGALLSITAIIQHHFGAIDTTLSVRQLSTLYPAITLHWSSQTIELGATETIPLQHILKFDDSVYRAYSNGTSTVTLLILRWLPNSKSRSDTGFNAHHPDSCFPGSGWQSISAQHETPLQYGLWRSQPVESRIFVKGNATAYVWFWHLRAGQLSGYMVGSRSDILSRIPYYIYQWKRGWVNGRQPEELFVRIVSTDPPSTPAIAELLTDFAKSLARAGVFKPVGENP